MTTQSKAEGGRRKDESAGDVPVPHASFSPQPSSFPPDAFTAFAPRLETHWFLCERQEPVGKTVRYTVREKPEGDEVGFLFWDSHRKEYLFAVTQPRVFPPRWIAEMTEILVYLTQRQRRRTTGRAR